MCTAFIKTCWSLLPTIIVWLLFFLLWLSLFVKGPLQTQQKFLYTKVTFKKPTLFLVELSIFPQILPLLAAVSHPKSATLLGWHAEGPFLHNAKRGAHMPEYLLTAPDGSCPFLSDLHHVWIDTYLHWRLYYLRKRLRAFRSSRSNRTNY